MIARRTRAIPGHASPPQMITDADSRALSASARETIEYLRSPAAIRERAGRVYERGLAGQLAHFEVRVDALDAIADYVADVTRAAYPDLNIPYHSRWSHFAIGGRLARLTARLADADPIERGRCLYDLVIVSSILSAGAGETWRYTEPETGEVFSRSEGLALASFDLFCRGGFSGDPDRPLRADADALVAIDTRTLSTAFQAGPDNPLVGASGRAGLLQRLGRAARRTPVYFGDRARPGLLFDFLLDRARAGGDALPAADILAAVLDGLGQIWRGKVIIGNLNLGDVWHHDAAGGAGHSKGLVPLHLLPQWLTYSLIEPLEAAGVRVTELNALTGLAEYRNGGLFVDMGALVPRHDGVTDRAHRPESEIIVEWRALTLVLLDKLADRVRQRLGVDSVSLPLVRVLEGGTWSAGRQIAQQRRAGGVPPIRIDSDGTVF